MWDIKDRPEPDGLAATWDDVARYFARMWGLRIGLWSDPTFTAGRVEGMTEEQAAARIEAGRDEAITQRNAWVRRLIHDHYVPIEESSDAARSRLRKIQELLPDPGVIGGGEEKESRAGPGAHEGNQGGEAERPNGPTHGGSQAALE